MMGLSESRDMRGMLDMEFGMSTPQAMGNQKVFCFHRNCPMCD